MNRSGKVKEKKRRKEKDKMIYMNLFTAHFFSLILFMFLIFNISKCKFGPSLWNNKQQQQSSFHIIYLQFERRRRSNLNIMTSSSIR